MVDEEPPTPQMTWDEALSILDANFDFRMPTEMGSRVSYRLAPNGRSLTVRKSSLGVILDLPIQVSGLNEDLPSPGKGVHRYILRGPDDIELAAKEFRLTEIGLQQDFLPVPVPLPPIPDGVEAIGSMRSDVNQFVACAMFSRSDGATLTELQKSCGKYSREYFENDKPMPRQTANMTKSKFGHHWQWTSSKTSCEVAKTGKFRGGEPVFKLVNYRAQSVPLYANQNDGSVKVNMKTLGKPVVEATNTILYGPPGTGKTFSTAERAVMLCDGILPATRRELMSRYEVLRGEQRISFVTFHQSFGYEEFVEGLRPHLSVGNQVAYSVLPGVFRRACDAARVRERVKPGLTGKPLTQRTIWKMSLGASWSDEGAKVFKYAMENECVLLGYGDEVDFTGCNDEASIKAKLLEEAPDTNKLDAHVRPVNLLKNEIMEGDIIVVSNGNKSFRGIAEVTGEYEFVDDAPFHQVRSVKWLAIFEPAKPVGEIFHKGFSMQTLYKLSSGGLNFEKLDALLSAEVDEPMIQPHVLIIDEINRANISKVFGELITLLEPDKREGAENAISVKLPYSGDDFSVPANLHVIGTMNTADRSIALLDTALRRRFDFEELEPNPSLLSTVSVPGIDLVQLLASLNLRIETLFDRDHRIGHAFFFGVKDLDGLEKVFRRKVIPLLQEYFYENWSNVRRALNDSRSGDFIVSTKLDQLAADGVESFSDEPRVVYRVNKLPFPVEAYQRIYAGK
jgi:5-methylcytosine-specific restriction protein B